MPKKEKEKQEHVWHIAWVGQASSPDISGDSFAIVQWVCDRGLCGATQFELVKMQFVCMNTQRMRIELCKGGKTDDNCHCNCHTRKAIPLKDCLGGEPEHSFLADTD